MSSMLAGFGSRLVGYDPSLHASDLLWGRWRIEPLGLRELLETADAVCVQLPYYSRYQGLLGERYLPFCKPGQVLVSTSHSALFDAEALAAALHGGWLTSAWLDSVTPGLLDPGQALHGVPNLHVTGRLAGYTQESRVRSVWAVAQRLDEILSQTPPVAREFRTSAPMPFSGPVSMPGPLLGAASRPTPLDEAPDEPGGQVVGRPEVLEVREPLDVDFSPDEHADHADGPASR